MSKSGIMKKRFTRKENAYVEVKFKSVKTLFSRYADLTWIFSYELSRYYYFLPPYRKKSVKCQKALLSCYLIFL